MQKCSVRLLAILVNALILSAADVTGTWKGTLAPENRDAAPALVILKQTGDTITGTVGPDESERNEIANGKVIQDKVTFDVPRENGTMRFALTVGADTLTGEVLRDRAGQQQMAKLNLKREK